MVLVPLQGIPDHHWWGAHRRGALPVLATDILPSLSFNFNFKFLCLFEQDRVCDEAHFLECWILYFPRC